MVVVDPAPLMAVTLEPWAWSIRFAQSPLLNCDWRPPSQIAGEYIGLHVGKSWTKRERLNASAMSTRYHPEFQVPLSPDGYLFSHLFGVARVAGFVDLEYGDERGAFTRIVDTSRGRAWIGGHLATMKSASIRNGGTVHVLGF